MPLSRNIEQRHSEIYDNLERSLAAARHSSNIGAFTPTYRRLIGELREMEAQSRTDGYIRRLREYIKRYRNELNEAIADGNMAGAGDKLSSIRRCNRSIDDAIAKQRRTQPDYQPPVEETTNNA